MNQHDFEHRVIELWMTTRVPLTRANLLYFTKAPRKKLDAWLDAMVRESVIDIDSDDEGETIWSVRGAARPARGVERVEDMAKMQALSKEVRGGRGGAFGGLERIAARGVVEQALARRGGEKNVLVAGALGIFGPLGWIYSAPLKEAIPAAIIYAVLWRVLSWIPFLGMMVVPLLALSSILLGMVYAWQYNRNGETTPLFTGDEDRPRLPGKR
jgi:hypothetical protein